MANLNTHPHIEDIIFNKPSLKELIRLIKNGSVSAIWPSIQKEVDDWNATGRFLYKDIRDPDILFIKTVKTAMTVYYGDHTDISSSSMIDMDETNKKWKKILDLINKEKNLLITDNYYDNIEDIYPDPSLQLTEDSSIDENGFIINVDNIIEYKKNILALYKSYIDKISEFKTRIKNFTPENITSSYNISDSLLFNGQEDNNNDSVYQTFFNNYETEVNDLILNIPLPRQTITEEEILEILVENDIYNFEKIEEFYKDNRLSIDSIINLIGKYYLDEDGSSILSKYSANHFVSTGPLDTLQSNYIKDKNNLEREIYLFNTEWDIENKNGLNLIQQVTIPFLNVNNISLDDQERYLNDLDLFYTEKLYPYQTLVLNKYNIINRLTDKQESISFWNDLLLNVKDQINSAEEKTFDYIVYLVNQKFYHVINEMNINEQITIPGVNNIINFLSTGTIQNYQNILDSLDSFTNTIILEQEIIDQYLTNNQEKIDSNKILGYQNSIKTQIQSFININENTGKNKIQTDQDTIIQNIQTANNIFYNFIKKLKSLKFISVDHPTESNPQYTINIENKTIEGLDIYKNAILNQQTKIKEYCNMLLTPGLGYDNLGVTIDNLDNEVNNIIGQINGLYIITSEMGSEDEFYEKVIKDDFTEQTICNLLLRITKNEIAYNENAMIPKPSIDFLSIANASQVIATLDSIIAKGENLNRLSYLTTRIDAINTYLETWYPIYDQQSNDHYICISVGSDIQFKNEIEYPADKSRKEELDEKDIDASITMVIDDEYHYPKINNLATVDNIGSNTRNDQILTVGGLVGLFGGGTTDDLFSRNVGSNFTPIHISTGSFVKCNNVISGKYSGTDQKGSTTYWDVRRDNGTSDGESVGLQAKKLFGAVYNDYAEYRSAEAHPGRCIIENGNGTLSLSSGRLQLGANIVSDTYGFAIGETNEATCPVAVCGRVLAYPLESKELYTPGAAVCSGPDGTISLMTREEIREWPDAIVGYVSEVPTYDTWGSDNVPVNGRIWIKIK